MSKQSEVQKFLAKHPGPWRWQDNDSSESLLDANGAEVLGAQGGSYCTGYFERSEDASSFFRWLPVVVRAGAAQEDLVREVERLESALEIERQRVRDLQYSLQSERRERQSAEGKLRSIQTKLSKLL